MQKPVTYTEAIARKYPEAIAIAIAKDAEGKHNPITLGWVMCTSHEPPMLAISIGLTRHSLETIRQAKAFVVSFPSAAQKKEALFYGTNSGRDMDKIAKFGGKTQPATKIDSVLLADAVANFECELDGELLTGDHVIFAGKVVASHANEDSEIGRLYTTGTDYRMGGVKEAE